MLLIIAVGLIIGFVLGLTGAGGSIFAVPLLILCFQLPMYEATGIALGAVCLAAIVGVFIRRRSGDVRIEIAAYLAASGIVFAPIGRLVSTMIAEPLLLALFCMLALYIVVNMWLKVVASEVTVVMSKATVDGGEIAVTTWASYSKAKKIVRLNSVGIVCGFLSGLFGVGGGFLIVPALTLFLHLSIQQAMATSLLVISAVSAAGFITHVSIGADVAPSFFLLLSTGSVLGIVMGSYVAKKLPVKAIQQVFAGTVILLIAVMLIKFLS